ncbi:toll/interleukin-1 receptor domain-containing protein [Pectobacterium brasiliense]|uniref:toll/interleukin-1 receptor domain-containing protein n=1 Tax=Pectobacterium brasiliense TaxID=180957 RepID=UPI0004E63548|nr:toll/interleukin-1 receptor domain-containing protein [Pectobacterium brasiliense]KFF62087.1 hypothetical protein IW00_19420 [Pectobacterium brasiliense]
MFADVGIRNFNASSLSFNEDEVSAYREDNRRHFDTRKLEEYLLDWNNVLDVEKISKDFFPKVEADVFLSHSHYDENDVIKLAIELERKGLKVFVDSCVWGWADNLLKKIDDKYCLKDDGYYNYKSRNRTTSNIYMILNSALHSTISQSELFLFLHTESSISMSSIYTGDEHIASPWIFSELNFAKLCQRTPRKQHICIRESLAGMEKRACDFADVQFAYPNPGTRYEIDSHDFFQWLDMPVEQFYDNNELSALYHLDKLYEKIEVPHILLEEPRYIVR